MLGKLRKNKLELAEPDNSLTLYCDPNLTLKQFKVGTDDMVEMNMHYTGHGGKLLYYREDMEKMARDILNLDTADTGLHVEKTDRQLIALAIDMLINFSSDNLDKETVERLKTVKTWFEAGSK